MRLAASILILSVLCSCGGEGDEGSSRLAGPTQTPDPVDGGPQIETNASIRYALNMLTAVHESVGRPELTREIEDRETEYTRYWLKRALHRDLFRRITPEHTRFLSSVGPRKDDAVVISLEDQGDHYLVVDGRLLILAIGGATASMDRVSACFARAVNYGYHLGKGRASFTVEARGPSGGKPRWGEVSVERGLATGWFASPVLWYTLRDDVVLVFEKVLKPPPSKIPFPVRRAPEFVGGISAADARPYLRFVSSNRQALSEEFFSDRKARPVEKAHDGEIKGELITKD